MTTLMMILGGVLVGLGVGLMSPTPPKKKPWKPKKKNFFVRVGEQLDDEYYW